MRQRLEHTGAGIEQLLCFIGDDNLQSFLLRAPAFQMLDQLIGLVVNIDHDEIDAARDQSIDRMVDQRFAREFDQRLWSRNGERSHPGAESRRQNYGAIQLRHARLSPTMRASAGIMASYHSLTGASAS